MALQETAAKVKNSDAQAAQQALEATYREILEKRYLAYLEGGLDTTAGYLRGKKESSNPGRHLIKAAEQTPVLHKEVPIFFKAFRNFPRDGAADINNQFLWIKGEAQDRPNYALAHRMARFGSENALMTERQFYVSHSYNALQIICGAFPVEEQTILVYSNRTFTDQIGGFGGGMKRKIGRDLMKKQLVGFFEDFRDDVQE